MRTRRRTLGLCLALALLLSAFIAFVSVTSHATTGEILFSNNASSKLALGITAGQTTITVNPGDGDLLFPSPSTATGTYFMATLVKADGDYEIVKVTARSADTFTVVRAQEGTSAKAFNVGDHIGNRVTKGTLQSLVQEVDLGVNWYYEIKGVKYVNADPAITDHSSAGTTGSFAWVLAQTGSDQCVIEFPSGGTYALSAAVTVPANVTMVIDPGAQIQFGDNSVINGALRIAGSQTTPAVSVASGKSVAIHGPYNGPKFFKVFSGSGTVVFYPDSTEWVYPQEFEGSTVTSSGIQKAINAAQTAAAIPVRLIAGTYTLSTSITTAGIERPFILIGDNSETTILQTTSAIEMMDINKDETTVVSGVILKGFTLDGNGVDYIYPDDPKNATAGVVLDYGFDVLMEDVRVRDINGTAIQWRGVWDSKMANVQVQKAGKYASTLPAVYIGTANLGTASERQSNSIRIDPECNFARNEYTALLLDRAAAVELDHTKLHGPTSTELPPGSVDLIRLKGARRIVLEGLQMAHNRGVGIWVGADDDGNNSDVTISNNIGANAANYDAVYSTITSITKANPAAVTTSAAHGYSTGDKIYITRSDMTELNHTMDAAARVITVTGANTFTLDGVDSSAYAVVGTEGYAVRTDCPKSWWIYVNDGSARIYGNRSYGVDLDIPESVSYTTAGGDIYVTAGNVGDVTIGQNSFQETAGHSIRNDDAAWSVPMHVSYDFLVDSSSRYLMRTFLSNVNTNQRRELWRLLVDGQMKYYNDDGTVNYYLSRVAPNIFGINSSTADIRFDVDYIHLKAVTAEPTVPALDNGTFIYAHTWNPGEGSDAFYLRTPAGWQRIHYGGYTGGSAGAIDKAVPFNDGGTQADSGLRYDKATGKLGLGVDPTNDFGLDGTADRYIGPERNTVAGGAGYMLDLHAGAAKAGATDKDGGTLRLAPGVSTGTGSAVAEIMRNFEGATGTTDNAQIVAAQYPSSRPLVDGVAVDLTTIPLLNTRRAAGGVIEYSIVAADAVDVQLIQGRLDWWAINKGGVYTASSTDTVAGNPCSAGTLTSTWTITPGAQQIVIAVNANTSLAAPTNFRIYYSVPHYGGQGYPTY